MNVVITVKRAGQAPERILGQLDPTLAPEDVRLAARWIADAPESEIVAIEPAPREASVRGARMGRLAGSVFA